MPKLKHIAISVRDPDAAADFFVKVFDMQIVRSVDGEYGKASFVSDGNMNVALIKFKSAAGLGSDHPLDFEGLHHIGFQVEDVADIERRIKGTGFPPRDDINLAVGLGSRPSAEGVEYKYSGPGGIIFDVSQKGWDWHSSRK